MLRKKYKYVFAFQISQEGFMADNQRSEQQPPPEENAEELDQRRREIVEAMMKPGKGALAQGLPSWNGN